MSKRRLLYIELKTGYSDNGPAWISNVAFSKSGRTIYFDGKALARIHGGGVEGNYFDMVSREEYWVSGVKKDGTNRHWAGSGKVRIDRSSLNEFLHHTGQRILDSTRFEVCSDPKPTDPHQFYELENRKL
jgi:hypothetical protein